MADTGQSGGRLCPEHWLPVGQALRQCCPYSSSSSPLCPPHLQFNTLMAAAVASGDCPLALQMHQRLRSAGLRPDGLTYTVLIQVGGRLTFVWQQACTRLAWQAGRVCSAACFGAPRLHDAVGWQTRCSCEVHSTLLCCLPTSRPTPGTRPHGQGDGRHGHI